MLIKRLGLILTKAISWFKKKEEYSHDVVEILNPIIKSVINKR